MAYVYGTGSLVAEPLESDVTLAYRHKDVTGTGAMVAEESEVVASGIGYTDGDILSYITDLQSEPAIMSGVGRASNLDGIPRATCDPIRAEFHTCTTKIQARFKIG